MKRKMRLTPELVARVHRTIEDPGHIPGMMRVDDSYFDDTARQILAANPENGCLWVFAFGSLIWKPRFESVERRIGVVRGWHRAFCLGPDRRYRGNMEQPGLMLSLDRGGQCTGVAFRIHADNAAAQLCGLLRQEPPIPPSWVKVETQAGPVKAIAFVCDRKHRAYVGGLGADEIADRLATAVGFRGSMAEYVHNTVSHLEELGIHDPYLWRIQELVAERIEAMTDGSRIARS